MDNLKISVILPMYNVEEFVKSCLDSICQQSYQNLEIICVDDGSTDKTSDLVKSYPDNRISYVYQENQGSGKARNHGLSLASGDYILFFDADDILEKNALSTFIKACQKGQMDVVMGNYSMIDKDGRRFENNPDHLLSQLGNQSLTDLSAFAFCSPFPGNKFLKRAFLLDHQLYFEPIPIAQDLNFYLKLLAHRPQMLVISDMILEYRAYEGSVSKSYDGRLKAIAQVFENIADGHYSFYQENPKILPTVTYNHVTYQLMKCMKIHDRKLRSEVFDYLIHLIRTIPQDSLLSEYLIAEAKEYTPIALDDKKRFLSMPLRWKYHGFHKRHFFKNFY